MAQRFGNLKTPGGLNLLNEHCTKYSYVGGHKPTQDDLSVLFALAGAPDASRFPHANRWFNHMASFTAAEKKAWPGTPATAPAAPAAAAAAASDAVSTAAVSLFDDDEEEEEKPKKAAAPAAAAVTVSLFGDDDDEEEEEKPKKAAAPAPAPAAAAAPKKGGRIEKSQVVFDVKPWEPEQDLEALAAKIKAIEIADCQWGVGHKIEPIAFGVCKLQVSCVIIDSTVSTEHIMEEITKFEDEVQSVDIFAFNKI